MSGEICGNCGAVEYLNDDSLCLTCTRALAYKDKQLESSEPEDFEELE